jgi:cytoskeletal protein CcmA (bactofilin family)
LHLDGRIEGAVLGEGPDAVFTLSEHGHVQGEIRVPHAIINGPVQGNVQVSERLELAPQARIVGDVSYSTLEMSAGAQVNGRMAHQTGEPVRGELPAPSLNEAEAVPA